MVALSAPSSRLYLKPFFCDQRLSAITKFTVDRYKKRRWLTTKLMPS